MKFHRTPQFREDFNNLEETDRIAVINAFGDVAEALQGNGELRYHFRIKKMEGRDEIWEGHIKINLCFTFQFSVNKEGEKVCFFRRVGTHEIYSRP
jgi:mRNA-degrading endonuclease YafQ of YafQ-DinJ toxin-antitoxin module